MKVKIMTKAVDEEHLVTGATLVFKTIRTGYPTAEIECYDNTRGSNLCDQVEKACDNARVDYIHALPEIRPWTWMQQQVNYETGTIVFVDADVMFWENCENWTFGKALFAGRFIPAYYEPLFKAICNARIHPSHFVIPDVEKFKSRIEEARKNHWQFDPFAFYSFKSGKDWYYYDTLSNMSHTFSDEAFIFKPEHLDCYDHLFGGHMAKAVGECREGLIRESYQAQVELCRRGNHEDLKGLWVEQQQYYDSVKL